MSVPHLNDDAKLDNLLVGQKDKILQLINNGQLAAATASLSVVRELWEACNYGYKVQEVECRIKAAKAEIEREREEATERMFNW